MAVENDCKPITSFDDWYERRSEDPRTGCLEYRDLSPAAKEYSNRYSKFKHEMDKRVSNYYKLEMLADNEVITKHPDLPNISSGETAGIIRRIARNLVQNTPNVEVRGVHDDDSQAGILVESTLRTKIIGSDEYSNDMQQNLFSSTKTAFTLGFDTVIPVLLQKGNGEWYIKYDPIHYRDVFPEPGAKDVRQATEVFVRRYLTRGEVKALLNNQVPGWDPAALRNLLKNPPRSKHAQSVDHQNRKHHTIPDGYSVITWYNSYGDNFVTFQEESKELLRIEKNNHPSKEHPVFFLVLEKDAQQPLGKSQVELLIGRQEFQDLMLNGAMKLWYRNINPSIIGYGVVNGIPNLSPGKYTEIKNPNARLEAFEVNTQTLLQHGSIAQQNLASMVQLVGAADQQMATQGGTTGMSATPQGVEAQQEMVDITTNNYQKAIESFFSHYCSYALTLYFNELKALKKFVPSADTRARLKDAGMKDDAYEEDGSLKVDVKKLAREYYVRCVPGSLVEMEDEKQLRLLQEFLVPLSQAMPAFATAGDPELLQNAAATVQYIMVKLLDLSGSSSATELTKRITGNGDASPYKELTSRSQALEVQMSDLGENLLLGVEKQDQEIDSIKEQLAVQSEALQAILDHIGVDSSGSTVNSPSTSQEVPQ